MDILEKINGYKTYAIIAAGVIYALYGMHIGSLSTMEGTTIILNSLGLGGLRSAIKKVE